MGKLRKIISRYQLGTKREYAKMQEQFYEETVEVMAAADHSEHDDNPYLEILGYGPVFRNKNFFEDGIALDFACGTGRNMRNLWKLGIFSEVVGVDISSNNLDVAKNRLLEQFPNGKFGFIKGDGLSFELPSKVKFVFSTIAFQHISSHEIRFGLMSTIFEFLENEGVFSFQMGFDGLSRTKKSRLSSVPYKSNSFGAKETNGEFDTRVDDPNQIVSDLKKIGFVDIEWAITPSWSDDGHANWIWVWAKK